MKQVFELLDLILEKCMWSSVQSTQDLKKYLLEETDEFIEALDSKDKEHMTEEMGDVLYNVIFMCKVAEREGLFTWDQVIEVLVEKILRRNPHIFAGREVENLDDFAMMWKEIKAAEKEAKNKRQQLSDNS